MFKVNEEKLLNDYKELLDKKENGILKIEEEAKEIAIKRGYDEEKTKKFIDYVKGFEDSGLNKDDELKLLFLQEYVEVLEENNYVDLSSIQSLETVEGNIENKQEIL